MKSTLRVLWSLVLLFPVPHILAQETGFKVIVHPSINVDSLPRIETSRMFLKEITDWRGSGDQVMPVDLGTESPIRESFSQAIHRKKVVLIKNYWRHRIFSGRATPPTELRTEQQVIDYVKSTPGAIGYVSDGANTDGVKVLTISGLRRE